MQNVHCGVLALQGDIEEHEQALAKLHVQSTRILHANQLAGLSHLILPGGESTTMSLFFREPQGQELKKTIQDRVQCGELAVFGTCAGAILLAENVISHHSIENMGLIEATLSRNAYGSQLDSFEAEIEFLPLQKKINAVFIRAPKIVEYGSSVEVLARHEDEPVMLHQGRVLLGTFHPEYIDPPCVHEYFLGM